MNEPPEGQTIPVARRLVLFFPGFESMPVEAHCRRFVRELRKTAPVYGFTVPDEVAVVLHETGARSSRSFEIATLGKNWTTTTEVVVYGMEDVSTAYAERNTTLRLAGGLIALADFFFTGTFFRFVAVSWRYALFFLYPLVLLAGIVLVSWLIYAAFADFGLLAALAAAFAAASLLLLLAFRRMHLLLMMDDWSFARDIARDRRPAIRSHLEAITNDVRSRMADGRHDEVVFAAHSFGAITAVSVLAALLRRDAAGMNRRVGLLAVGSSLLKIALHPAAAWLREDVGTVVRSECDWLDVQSLTDPINFYKTDPARELAIQAGNPVHTMQVRFRSQLSPETYRSIRRNFFRVHRQFVFGVERRSPYSFHAILCGPEPFVAVARRRGLAEHRDDFNDPQETQGTTS